MAEIDLPSKVQVFAASLRPEGPGLAAELVLFERGAGRPRRLPPRRAAHPRRQARADALRRCQRHGLDERAPGPPPPRGALTCPPGPPGSQISVGTARPHRMVVVEWQLRRSARPLRGTSTGTRLTRLKTFTGGAPGKQAPRADLFEIEQLLRGLADRLLRRGSPRAAPPWRGARRR